MSDGSADMKLYIGVLSFRDEGNFPVPLPVFSATEPTPFQVAELYDINYGEYDEEKYIEVHGPETPKVWDGVENESSG